MNSQQKTNIILQVKKWLEIAEKCYGIKLPKITVQFDLTGTSAGQYHAKKPPLIRFNSQIAAQQFDDFCSRTVPHEVAHYVVARLAGRKKYRPHGLEWQQVMQDFGLDASRCHDYDLAKVQVRRQRRFTYQCNCQQHELTSTRHFRVLRGGSSYHCRQCGTKLQAIA